MRGWSCGVPVSMVVRVGVLVVVLMPVGMNMRLFRRQGVHLVPELWKP